MYSGNEGPYGVMSGSCDVGECMMHQLVDGMAVDKCSYKNVVVSIFFSIIPIRLL